MRTNWKPYSNTSMKTWTVCTITSNMTCLNFASGISETTFRTTTMPISRKNKFGPILPKSGWTNTDISGMLTTKLNCTLIITPSPNRFEPNMISTWQATGSSLNVSNELWGRNAAPYIRGSREKYGWDLEKEVAQ